MANEPREMQIRAIDVNTVEEDGYEHDTWRVEQYENGEWRKIEVRRETINKQKGYHHPP